MNSIHAKIVKIVLTVTGSALEGGAGRNPGNGGQLQYLMLEEKFGYRDRGPRWIRRLGEVLLPLRQERVQVLVHVHVVPMKDLTTI